MVLDLNKGSIKGVRSGYADSLSAKAFSTLGALSSTMTAMPSVAMVGRKLPSNSASQLSGGVRLEDFSGVTLS